jgi:hypothetical protein
MGLDATAVTIIGVKISQEKLKKYLKKCECGFTDDDSFCPECCASIKIESPSILPYSEGETPIIQTQEYVLYQENLENEYDYENLFICLDIQKKERHDKIGKYVKMEIKNKDFFKNILVEGKLLTEEEFEENFGIYTFLETSW